jgi:hypothetical protein
VSEQWPHDVVAKGFDFVMGNRPGPSPIMPTERFNDHDSGVVKLRQAIAVQLDLSFDQSESYATLTRAIVEAALDANEGRPAVDAARELLGFTKRSKEELDEIASQKHPELSDVVRAAGYRSKEFRYYLAWLWDGQGEFNAKKARIHQRKVWAPATSRVLELFLYEHRERALELAAQHGLYKKPASSRDSAPIQELTSGANGQASPQSIRRRSVNPKLEPIIQDLADLIRRQLQEEQRFDDAHAGTPMPIRLSDRGHSLRGGGEYSPDLTLPSGPTSVADLARHVAELFESAPMPHTLFLLGKQGSGKSFFARELALTLLQEHRPDDSIPVIFNISSWNPANKALGIWVTDQLIEGYPNLKKKQRRLGTLASQLVNSNCVLPILDGFDEIAPKLRATAIREIYKYVSRGGALIVTSRPREHLEAASPAAQPMGVTYVQIDDLTPNDVAKYLSTGSRVTAAEWNRLLSKEDLTSSKSTGNALQEALTTPLMVSLAKSVYGVDRDVNPSELLNPESFHTKEAIEKHLLGRFMEAKYSHRPQDPDVLRMQNYDQDEARRWLGFIATCMAAGKTRGFTWWRPPVRLLMLPSITVAAAVSAVGLLAVLDYANRAIYVFQDGVPTASLLSNVALVSCVIISVGAIAGNHASPTSMLPGNPKAARSFATSPMAAAPEGVMGIVSIGVTFFLTVQLGDVRHMPKVEGIFNHSLVVAAFALLMFGGRELYVYYSSTDATNPRVLFRQDLKASLFRAIATGALITFAFIPLWRTRGYNEWAAMVPTLFVVSVLGAFLASASGSWLLRVAIFSAIGLLPRGCLAFLEGARRRGVLRQSSGAYEFRDALLRDQLASEFMSDDSRWFRMPRTVRAARTALGQAGSRRDIPPS